MFQLLVEAVMTRKLNDDGQESILQEAHRLTHGDRNSTYGHPYDDYTCTAALASAILSEKLKAPITAHEMALVMCCVKLSRESRVPKRDNLVDLAGYAWVARMCHEEHTALYFPAPPPVVLTVDPPSSGDAAYASSRADELASRYAGDPP